jgi:hypothetical protein
VIANSGLNPGELVSTDSYAPVEQFLALSPDQIYAQTAVYGRCRSHRDQKLGALRCSQGFVQIGHGFSLGKLGF